MKKLIKNITLSAIIGLILGIITEHALILNISWLIKITQSFSFWGIIICISALFSKKYLLSLLNPTIIMSLMNSAYYSIRLIMSGYTNIYDWEMYTLTGIAGSMYLGTFVSIIKEIIIHHKISNIYKIYNFIFMSISGILFTIYGFYNPILNNLFYNIDLGIIIGLIIGIIIAKFSRKKVKSSV